MNKVIIFAVFLCARSTLAQFLPGGMLMNGMLGQQGLGQQPSVLTCISQDMQDSTTQMRFTFTELQNNMGMMGMPFNGVGFGSSDAPTTWDVSGYYKPSDVLQMNGVQLQVVVTQNGRVRDGCFGELLGPALTSNSNPMLGGLGMFNPYLAMQQGMFGGAFQTRPAGHLEKPVVAVRGGLNMYSTTLQGISRTQLQGAAVALCPAVTANGQCMGPVVACCTIAKDSRMASQMPTPGLVQAGMGQAGFPIGGVSPFPGVMGGGVMGGGVLGGGAIGVPFDGIDNGMLAFTDPNAAASENTRPSVDGATSSPL